MGSRPSSSHPSWIPNFNYPFGIAVHGDGAVLLADRRNCVIRRISAAGEVSTFAGSGSAGAEDGSGEEARFNYPSAVAYDPTTGTVLVCDTYNGSVRRITPV